MALSSWSFCSVVYFRPFLLDNLFFAVKPSRVLARSVNYLIRCFYCLLATRFPPSHPVFYIYSWFKILTLVIHIVILYLFIYIIVNFIYIYYCKPCPSGLVFSAGKKLAFTTPVVMVNCNPYDRVSGMVQCLS